MELTLHNYDYGSQSDLFCFHLINEIKYIYKFVFAVATPTRQNCNLVTCNVTSDQVTVAYKLRVNCSVYI